MNSISQNLILAVAIFALPIGTSGSQIEENSSEITGSIRSPREGEKITGNFIFKGRTRGAPDAFVAMVFLEYPRAESFFPYGEPGEANRSFSCMIYHRSLDLGNLLVHLYVLPDADAKKLAAWHSEAVRLVEAGMERKIEPFDPVLMKQAVKVASQEYVVKRD